MIAINATMSSMIPMNVSQAIALSLEPEQPSKAEQCGLTGAPTGHRYENSTYHTLKRMVIPYMDGPRFVKWISTLVHQGWQSYHQMPLCQLRPNESARIIHEK
jgi:hypothetical protein